MATDDQRQKARNLLHTEGMLLLEELKSLEVDVKATYHKLHGPFHHDLIIIVANDTFDHPNFPDVYRFIRDREKKLETTTFTLHFYLFTEKEAQENTKLERRGYLNVPFA